LVVLRGVIHNPSRKIPAKPPHGPCLNPSQTGGNPLSH
jgi:hypothetical protein